MRVQTIDTVGMEGHRSAFLADLAAPGMKPGDIIEIWGDSPTFENELRLWCKWSRKTVLSVEHESLKTKIRIQF
jgi:TusA-related sulfurtransferase